MTLESSLPYVSSLSALAAGLTTGVESRPSERALKALAFCAVAVFAYFRWIAPSEAGIALLLAGVGQAALPRALGFVAVAASWLVFAWLFFQTGDGPSVFVSDAIRAGMFALLAVAAVLALRRLWRAPPGPRPAVLAAAGALLLMASAAITLDWSFWPAIAGAAGVVAAQLAGLHAAHVPPLGPQAPEAADTARRALWRKASWGVSYLGHAAIAYAFMK